METNGIRLFVAESFQKRALLIYVHRYEDVYNNML